MLEDCRYQYNLAPETLEQNPLANPLKLIPSPWKYHLRLCTVKQQQNTKVIAASNSWEEQMKLTTINWKHVVIMVFYVQLDRINIYYFFLSTSSKTFLVA